MDTSSTSMTNTTDVEVDGTSYSIDLPFADTDYIQRTIRSSGEPYELEMLRAMAASLSAGDLVLDVGANIGNHTLYLAAVSGADVIAYEPDLRLTEALTRSVSVNNLEQRVSVRNVAVADQTGELVLVDDVDGNMGGQHLSTEPDAEGPRVPVVRLDDEMPDGTVHAMKIDVEGYELNVLRGARSLIERDRPDLWIECLDADHYRSIAKTIVPLGYRFDGVFNASPTYHFVHDPDPKTEAVAAAVDQVIERFYADHDSYLSTRESLLAANAKYRTVTQQYGELRDRLSDEHQAGPDIETSSLLALRHAEERTTELQLRLNQTLEQGREREQSLAEEVHRFRTEKEQLAHDTRRRLHRLASARHAEAEDLKQRIKQRTSEIEELTAVRTASELALAEAKQTASTLEQNLQQREEELSALHRKQSRYRADFNLLREYISDTDIANEQLQADRDEQIAKLADSEESLRSTTRLLRAAEGRANNLQKQGQVLTRARDAQIALAASRAEELHKVTEERDSLRQRLAAAEKHQLVLKRARDAHFATTNSLRAELADRDEAWAATSNELQMVRGESESITDALQKTRAKLRDLRQSRTYRAGKAWRDAGTWTGFWLLIPRLAKIALERDNAR